MVEPWVWVAFIVGVVAMLLLDLFVFHREAHEISFREATLTSLVWIGIGLAFGGVVYLWLGPQAGGEYMAGYIIEKSLAVDNIFVFAIIFSAFAVPLEYQHRVLFWGVVGALVFRGLFIAGGVALLERFHWSIYFFGALLVVTGIRMATAKAHPDPTRNPVFRLFRRVVPTTDDYEGQRLIVRRAGKRMATPLLAVLVLIETTDVIFAIDSIPAIFAVTREPFLVFSSNVFAILGLRALYFMLAGMIDRFVYLKIGLSAVLVFVGVKMLAIDTFKIPIWLSLLVITSVVGTAIAASLWKTRGIQPAGEAGDEGDATPGSDADSGGHSSSQAP